MAHQRKQIRDAVVARLANATGAGTRVSATRVDPHKRGELPALSVYTPSEQVDPDGALTAPRELTRDLQLEIVGWVAHSDALPADDAMDALALEIEAALDSDSYPPLGGLAGDLILTGTTMDVLGEERSDVLVGVLKLTYSVTYRTFVDTSVATDDLLRVGATTQVIGGVADTAPITDLVTVQETP